LEKSPGVDWVGGVSRERSIELMSQAHVGLSWRSPELDDSLELSTKLLEYCAAGTPPLLNRTEMHERVFGSDYPLFVSTEEDVIDCLVDLAGDPDLYATALRSISDIARAYTLESTAARLASLVDRQFPHVLRDPDPEFDVEVGGEAPDLVEALNRSPRLSVRNEPTNAGDHHVIRIRARPTSSDAGSHHLVYLPFGGDGADSPGTNDTIVVPGSSTKRQLVSGFDVDAERVVTIPQPVDEVDTQRAKTGNARFHIAWFVSASTGSGEIEQVAELIGQLRRHDPRLILFLADDGIDDYSSLLRSGLLELLEQAGPGGVVFEGRPFGLSGWLRKIGFVISFQADPDSRTATAMASGAVPVILREPEEESWYGDRWSHGSIAGMADHVISLARDGTAWSRDSESARVEAAAIFGRDAVAERWLSLIRTLA
jgi:hypothetical protein